jgi:hypothetical protein
MKAKMLRVRDCAEVLPGFSAKSAIVDEPGGTVQVIMAQHLAKGKPYRYRHDHRLLINPPSGSERYFLKRGDILFMSRGPKNYAVLLEDVPQPAIAPLTFFIIKAKSNVIPAYLAWCLNQEAVRAQLSEIRTGAGTPMIPRQEFGEITIPVPPLATQRRIADLADLQSRETSLLRQLAEETERLQRLTGLQLLTCLMQKEKE